MSHSVCLFAYHDPAGTLAPHTRHLLNQIADCGFEIHVAVSSLSPQDHQGLENLKRSFTSGPNPVKATLYPRENAGLDFGSWQELLKQHCDEGADEILFANDSVFGPMAPLSPIVTRMRAAQHPIWGMVRSEAINRHLQSWFLVMTRQAFEHPAIQRVFRQPFCEMSKPEIVLHGELGLGLAMQAAEMDMAASWSGTRGIARLLAINPMHTDWRAVLRSGKAPFIKTELLRDNPSGIPSVHLWRQEIPDPAFFNPDWIAQYLANHPPRAQYKKAGFRARLVQAIASEDRLHALPALLLGR
ncbi:rhamnan synthesis F family protein [Gluconobacter japonicus]|uniref:rhamnan synthesis F family protein n=1 Tax=Gluconobacter japonicus TaxID=376620 RepID=UPI001B8B6E48|nr:rhamnan synthesis F family protein [Gluconobacter japonicus]MBS1051808.1 hypothetical protein [Gluconobacter japonicus]